MPKDLNRDSEGQFKDLLSVSFKKQKIISAKCVLLTFTSLAFNGLILGALIHLKPEGINLHKALFLIIPVWILLPVVLIHRRTRVAINGVTEKCPDCGLKLEGSLLRKAISRSECPNCGYTFK